MGMDFFSLGKKRLLGAALALLPGWCVVESGVHAQPATPIPQSAAGEAKVHIKSRVFHFPLHFDKVSQPRIREVVLYMRDSRGGDWVRVDRAVPTAKSIRCVVPHDGEFSFAVQTIDNYGNVYPMNLNQQPPTMTVVVQTEGQMMPPSMPQGPAIVAEPAVNVNPAPSQIPVQYTVPIEAFPGFPPPPGNEVVVPVTPPANPAQGPSVMPSVVPQPLAPTIPPAGTVRIINQSPLEQTNTPTIVQHSSPAQGPDNRRFFNTTRIGIDYNVSRVGPSGLGKVEVWATQDQGRTWQKVGDNAKQRSPAEADLPGEGTYGIRLVATNGNGFGGKAPTAGDPPAITVEVDLTGPVIHSVDVDPIAKNGALEIRYRISDKNLGNECINIYYASQRGGPWTAIAYKVKNENLYRWTLPRDVPAQIYFRMEVTDMANNVSRWDTQTPILLDMTEPDLNVIGVTAIQQKVSGSGN